MADAVGPACFDSVARTGPTAAECLRAVLESVHQAPPQM